MRWREIVWPVLLGLTAFTLASLAGGLAPAASVLIGAVALQGVGAALMTPQVLSIIQLHFAGESRARAIGAYSMVLAAGVATGLVLGGLLVSANLLVAALRPALLLNAPVGAMVLISARRYLPDTAGRARVRLDPAGAAALAAALLALIVPLTFGRDAGWPIWVWPCLAACAGSLAGYIRLERRIAAQGGDTLFDLDILELPGVAAGVSASLTWTRASATVRDRLPVAGPLVMATALLAVGLIARVAAGRWRR